MQNNQLLFPQIQQTLTEKIRIFLMFCIMYSIRIWCASKLTPNIYSRIILMCQIHVHCKINMNSNMSRLRHSVTQRRHGNADNHRSPWKCNTLRRKMSFNIHIRSFCFQLRSEQQTNTSTNNSPSKINKECELTIPKCIVETLVSIYTD
jgi:hypothetical protein